MVGHIDLVIDEAHEDTAINFVVEASSKVVVFEALGRHVAGMVKGFPLSSMVLVPS